MRAPARHVLVLLALAAFGACSDTPTDEAPGPRPTPDDAGTTRADPNGYVRYTIGNAPLILAAPHGGTLAPETLKDRTCADCVTVSDVFTRELAGAVADSFTARYGCRPHLVTSLLHRRKLDPNRDVAEAADGDPVAAATWSAYHGFLDTARARVARRPGTGLFVDLHGHGHDIARIELGYLLTGTALRGSDASLNTAGAVSASSLRILATRNRTGLPHAALVRGPSSLGALLADAGLRAVPSPAEPAPAATEPYFNGGYSTARHGSQPGGPVDGLQAELPGPGVRNTPAERARAAGLMARALGTFLRAHYADPLPDPCRASAR